MIQRNGPPVVQRLGLVDYRRTWRAMQDFTANRAPQTPDELWFLEHRPVFTRGLRSNDRLDLIKGIPVVHSDRGGDVTYHGPGQVVVYALIDLARARLGIKTLVRALEQSVIDLLADLRIKGQRRLGAPGVYVDGKKIAALGLRVRRGCSYHGLALNVNMDLTPFTYIDPCGYPDLQVTRLADLGIAATVEEIGEALCGHTLTALSYNARAGVKAASANTSHTDSYGIR